MLKGSQFIRWYSAATAANSLLGTLRRRSGFPLMKCKEALTKHDNDIEAAEKWLQEEAQKEGWTKMSKLQDRQAKQGHVGLALVNDRAAMVEVNCETDFVARNDQFKELVSSITRATFVSLIPKLLNTTNLSSQDILTSDAILNASVNLGEGGGVGGGGGVVADRVAETVGYFQEKISVSRGCTLCCTSGLLCGHIYNNRANIDSHELPVRMGSYGAILHINNNDPSVPLTTRDDLAELKKLGEQICQHIVGFNPGAIEGEGEGSEEGGGTLLSQQFLFDNSVTVGELLLKNSVQVTRFVRYALGEHEDNPWTGTDS